MQSINIAHWYDKHYSKSNDDVPSWYKYLYKIIDKNKKCILEIGCGTGIGAQILKGLYYPKKIKYLGIDQSKEAIKKACVKIREFDFRAVDLFKLSPSKERFDCVCLFEVIEHFNDPNKALNNIDDFLGEDSSFLISFPNYINLPWLLLRILSEKLNKPSWIVLQPIDKIYTIFDVVKIMKKRGYKLVRSYGTCFLPPLFNRWETEKSTDFLNRIGLSFLSFHPILLFEKDKIL